jgi:tetratricopeptide (TPR) repeat protein
MHAWEGLKQKLPADHPLLLLAQDKLAELYRRQGRYARAESLFRDVLERQRRLGVSSEVPRRLAETLASLALIQQHKYAEAEPLLRECCRIRQERQPDAWETFYTQSLLGASLLGEQKYAEAEPLLVAGYEGMKQREATIPSDHKDRLTDALERLVQLYDATGQKAKADAWRDKLAEAKAAASPPTKP